VANDYSYEDIFSRQLSALARAGDVLLTISTSGRSENIVRALKLASIMDVDTIALLGNSGGEAKAHADLSIIIPSDSTARIQEAHILIGHILCDLIEQEMCFA
jgi:D-sedoheptulose 7-phosphate isomerase